MDLIHHPKAAYHPAAPSWLLPALLGPGWLGIAPDNSDKGKQKALWLCPNRAVTRTPGSRVGFPSQPQRLGMIARPFLSPLPIPPRIHYLIPRTRGSHNQPRAQLPHYNTPVPLSSLGHPKFPFFGHVCPSLLEAEHQTQRGFLPHPPARGCSLPLRKG